MSGQRTSGVRAGHFLRIVPVLGASLISEHVGESGVFRFLGRLPGSRESGPAMNRSESIRQFIAKNPAAGPKDFEAGLKAEGIKVKLSLISAVKYSKAKKKSLKKTKRMARRATVQIAARRTPSTAVTIEQLIEVKQFAISFGGTDQVRQALDTLEQLR
jgi:hypothetical protein